MTAEYRENTEPRTHFGAQSVPESQKPALVRDVFARVAPRYDLMNDLMSGGVHRLWKSALIDRLDPRPGQQLLDVAGGTGDIALRALARVRRRTAGQAENIHDTQPPGLEITVCDASPEMLREGCRRSRQRGAGADITWLCGDAESLPLPDAAFDAVTIAFGIRNLTHINRALAEAHRVLRYGGHFLCLEFSRVAVIGLNKLYDAYSFRVIPAIGRLVTGNRDAYSYLVESIRRFPDQDLFAAMIGQAGFGNVTYRNLSGGIAAIHSGWKL